jgi:hypothetical protein
MTSMTASASSTIVRIVSAPSAAPAGVSISSAPAAASGSIFSNERFHVRTRKPLRSRACVIAKPIVPPAPSTAIVRSRLVAVMRMEFPAPPPRETV